MSVDYLRVSVTDRCNLRCIYCNPLSAEGVLDRREILTFEEIHRVVSLCAGCGIKKVRLTGGEPLIRRDLVHLVRMLSGIAALEELSMTTNGVLLAQYAEDLKKAGLTRVNVSLDAAEPMCYKRITGADTFADVIGGIHRALELCLTPVRINCVVLRDANLSQVPALAEMSVNLPITVRFIEYCPTSRDTKPASSCVPTSEVREVIESRLGPLCRTVLPRANGPAVYFKAKGAAGAIGFITGRTSVFCHRCNRLRLTSDGKMMPCLYCPVEYDLKKLLRNGAEDQDIQALVKQIIKDKSRHTRLTTTNAADFSIQKVGG